MSWWTDFRDSAEKAVTYGMYDPAKQRQAAHDQRSLINSQIQAYKDQTEITKNELATKKNEVMSEKRRVEEKQIRALRRSSRGQGFLGTQATSQPDMNTTLGG